MQIHSKTILASLKKIAPVMTGNKIMPILSYVKITDGCIEGTNLQITVHDMIETGETEPFLLPYEDLYRICNTINDDLNITDKKITVGKKDVFKLSKPEDVSLYPEKEIGSGVTFTLTAAIVLALKKASTCVLEQKATNMGNVNVAARDGKLHIASTNQSQLFYQIFDLEFDDTFDILITTDTIKTLQIDNYECMVTGSKVFFLSNTGAVSALLAEGRFPNYAPFLMQNDPETIDFNKNDLITALTKVTVYGDVSPHCDVVFTSDSVTFTVRNDLKEATASIEMENNISIGTVRLNAENMLKQMRLFEENDLVISMSLTAPNQVFIFTCINSDMKLMLMPLSPNA